MRRADRLFRLVQLLRARRLATATQIAAEPEVSTRTVYRDVADRIASGVPIDGEAGVGYALAHGFDLQDFRNFRPDRMRTVVLLEENFADEPGKHLAACLGAVEEELVRERGGRSRPAPP